MFIPQLFYCFGCRMVTVELVAGLVGWILGIKFVSNVANDQCWSSVESKSPQFVLLWMPDDQPRFRYISFCNLELLKLNSEAM